MVCALSHISLPNPYSGYCGIHLWYPLLTMACMIHNKQVKHLLYVRRGSVGGYQGPTTRRTLTTSWIGWYHTGIWGGYWTTNLPYRNIEASILPLNTCRVWVLLLPTIGPWHHCPTVPQSGHVTKGKSADYVQAGFIGTMYVISCGEDHDQQHKNMNRVPLSIPYLLEFCRQPLYEGSPHAD